MAGFFNYSKAGKGITKEDLEKSGLALYFDILGRRIWKLITLNLLYLLVSIPAILISIAISVYFLTLAASIRGVDVAKNSTSFATRESASFVYYVYCVFFTKSSTDKGLENLAVPLVGSV